MNSGGWPNFIIPGAGKSGTTTVANVLGQHPDIFISTPKEPTFFAYPEAQPQFISPDRFHEEIISDEQHYRSLFSDTGSCKALGEASTYYLAIPDKTVATIQRVVPKSDRLKIIIILRNPVDRAFSNHTMFSANEWEPLSFQEAISEDIIRSRMANGWSPSYDYIDEGMYFNKVQTFLNAFHDVRVYLFEDLQDRPRWLYEDIFSFLGVDTGFVPDTGTKFNVSGKVRSHRIHRFFQANSKVRKRAAQYARLFLTETQKASIKEYVRRVNLKKIHLSDKDRKNLTEIFLEDIENLEALIDRDLSRWK